MSPSQPLPASALACMILYSNSLHRISNDVTGLADLAVNADCMIELVPQVGDFVTRGDTLFRLYRGGEGSEVTCKSKPEARYSRGKGGRFISLRSSCPMGFPGYT